MLLLTVRKLQRRILWTRLYYYLSQENGFSYIEMNASAKRNKATLKGEVSAQLTSASIHSFMGVAGGGIKSSYKHVLIMDEVDGMAGNEDRGGMQVSGAGAVMNTFVRGGTVRYVYYQLITTLFTFFLVFILRYRTGVLLRLR